MNLTVITIDRYTAITNPFRYRARNPDTIKKAILSTWLLGVVITVTFYLLFTLVFTQEGKVYMNLLFPIPIFIAIFVFIFCYVRIYISVRNLGRTLKVSDVSFDVAAVQIAVITHSSVDVDGDNREQSPNRTAQRKRTVHLYRRRREKRLIKLAFRKILLFCVCWFPVAVCSCFLVAGVDFNMDIFSSFLVLANMNSLVNPIVYYMHARKKN